MASAEKPNSIRHSPGLPPPWHPWREGSIQDQHYEDWKKGVVEQRANQQIGHKRTIVEDRDENRAVRSLIFQVGIRHRGIYEECHNLRDEAA